MSVAPDTDRPARPGPAPRSAHVGRSIGRILLEVALISVGVFFALMGDQWRERTQHDELAQASLQHFRSEFAKNRDAVAAVRQVHADGLAAMQDYLNSTGDDRRRRAFPFNGTSPAFLEYTAWDLALATQALSYVESDLAHDIAHVYAVQRQLDDATRAITQVMYATPVTDDGTSFLSSMVIYFGDCTLIEPRLIRLYDEILPKLDAALART